MKEWKETQISILAVDTGSGWGGRGSGGQKKRGGARPRHKHTHTGRVGKERHTWLIKRTALEPDRDMNLTTKRSPRLRWKGAQTERHEKWNKCGGGGGGGGGGRLGKERYVREPLGGRQRAARAATALHYSWLNRRRL